MGDSESTFEDPASQDTSAQDEGSYAEPGAYTNPDGTTGYAGTQSGGDDPNLGEESGDYPASVGATLAVGGILIELGGGAVVAGMEAGGIISAGFAKAADVSMMVIDMGVEGGDAIFGGE